ncbi:lysozyme precursor-like protein [Dinothrombium tinctorium]|uniref:lysozyme n=1 Tax=Dinothrombium tinctorium TaxID=1965070 RepID=A0A443QCL5_9ACAR|nr:lysozyme precursor-like protein [Dinothrombium tinctorium]
MNAYKLSYLACFAIIVCFNLNLALSKQLARCDLAKQLFFKYKFIKRQIPSIICMAEHSSDLNVTSISEAKEDGSHAYGIFQIRDSDSCSSAENAGGECGVDCENLRDENLDDDVRCLRQILHKYGFSYWEEWKENCRDKFVLHYIHTCFI